MTFGYGPNTFPHSAAYVPNTNHSPSRSEGEPIKTNHTSAAKHKSLPASEGDPNINLSAHKSVPKATHFTGSDLREPSNSNKDDTKILLFTIR